jgi:hypothetical protein
MYFITAYKTSLSLLVCSVVKRVNKISKNDYYLRHVCLSVRPFVRLSFRMEQLGSHWTDFHEI